jgi:archaellum component FlaC
LDIEEDKMGNLAEELVAYRDKVNRLKKKYESRISSLIDKELEEFKAEFGQLPQGISVYSVKVNQIGDEAPYHLNITTDIDVGL